MPPRDPKPPKKPEPKAPPPPPPAPPEVVKGQSFSVIVCPFCGADRPKVLRTSPSASARWYECRSCRVFDSERGTVFKIPMRKAP